MDHEIERMLENWARWKVSGGWVGAVSISSLYNMGPRSPRSGNTIPVLNGEAEDMDRIIEGLADVRLKRAIVIQYQWGGEQETKARRCGCCVNTFKARLCKAKQMILSEKYRRADASRKNRCLQSDSECGIKAQNVFSVTAKPATAR